MPLTDVALIVSIVNGLGALLVSAGQLRDRWQKRRRPRHAPIRDAKAPGPKR